MHHASTGQIMSYCKSLSSGWRCRCSSVKASAAAYLQWIDNVCNQRVQHSPAAHNSLDLNPVLLLLCCCCA